MLHSKYVVVEVGTTTATMTLVQYLITHGFDKFTVVTDLFDHPSLKNKQLSGTTTTPSPGSVPGGGGTNSPHTTNGKPKASINDIASALSKKSASPPNQQSQIQAQQQRSNGCSVAATTTAAAAASSALARILEEKTARQNVEPTIDLQKLFGNSLEEDIEIPEENMIVKRELEEEQKTESSDSLDCGLGPSDEQIRGSLIHLINNPVLGSAFGITSGILEESPSRKRGCDESPAPKKHRWMTNGELEESRFGRGKSYGRVHCKATYKCALCGKPTTLNSTGSRWNLLRHVIMIHSECKPYQCFDCDFIGIKSNVVSHARQQGHRSDDALDITTDDMRNEWNQMLHACFPDYVKAKSRGWQPEEVKDETATSPEENGKDHDSVEPQLIEA